MVLRSKSFDTMILPLLAVLALLGWPRAARAAGTWSVLSLPQKPGEVTGPQAAAVDGVGNLYLADKDNGSRIQKRDAQGHWSALATAGYGYAPGQVDQPYGLAVDASGNLYVAGTGNNRVLMYAPHP